MDMICKNGHKMRHTKTVYNKELKKAVCPECGAAVSKIGEKSNEEKTKDLEKIVFGFVIAFIIACGYFAFSGDTSSSSSSSKTYCNSAPSGDVECWSWCTTDCDDICMRECC